MDYQAILSIMVESVEGIEREIDTEVRAEFQDLNEEIDVVLTSMKALDRSDMFRLNGQVTELLFITRMGTECTCDAHQRWHACLSRIESALLKGAERSKIGITQLMIDHGILTEDALEVVKGAKERRTKAELPELPTDIVIPNDASELTKDA